MAAAFLSLVSPDSSSPVLLLIAFSVVAHTVYGIIWRHPFSPVAMFPGPRLAALTFWNEFYYDVV